MRRITFSLGVQELQKQKKKLKVEGYWSREEVRIFSGNPTSFIRVVIKPFSAKWGHSSSPWDEVTAKPKQLSPTMGGKQIFDGLSEGVLQSHCSASNRAEGMKVPRLERHPLCIIQFLNLIRKGIQAQAVFVLTWSETHTKEMTHRRLKDLEEIVILHLILETLHDLYPLSAPMETMKVNTRCTSKSWQLWPLGEGTGIYRWQDSLEAHHTSWAADFQAH